MFGPVLENLVVFMSTYI